MEVATLEDVAARLGILQTIADYSYRFDARDAAGWSELFTEDGVWEFQPHQSGGALAPFRECGRAAIRAWAERRYRELGAAARFLHHQSTTSFDLLAGTEARTRTLVSVTRIDAGEPPRLSVAGVYHDVWRRTAEGWRLAHRRMAT